MSISPLKERLLTPSALFSVEFFPPKSNSAAEQLLCVAKDLMAYMPDFVSITYGAGGSSRTQTLKYAKKLRENYGYTVLPHLTCVGHSREELKEIIEEFREAGLSQIMALRGDPQSSEKDFKPHQDGLSHANELVQLTRKVHPECTIGVAGYPEKHAEAPSAHVDLLHLKQKVDNGADFITTQLFFDNAVYFDFVERARQAGITVPIIPGLMCANSLKQAKRFCKMGGTSLPAKFEARLLAASENSGASKPIGIDWMHTQALELLERGAPGLHLYILNQAGPAVALMKKLHA
ncbi:MAG: methylenetetrahydrofolate reductase [NAD(P)H], partial [Verrucomicrobiota bacterium]|nr:methylenetetrahydrofolate reductase [NAD(P)H] [Verrucomicrobiota bacterium]